jgi:hypothetical protein
MVSVMVTVRFSFRVIIIFRVRVRTDVGVVVDYG